MTTTLNRLAVLFWITAALFTTSCGFTESPSGISSKNSSILHEAECGDHWFNARAEIKEKTATIFLDGDSGPTQIPIKALVELEVIEGGYSQYQLTFGDGGYLKISMIQSPHGVGYWRGSKNQIEQSMECYLQPVSSSIKI